MDRLQSDIMQIAWRKSVKTDLHSGRMLLVKVVTLTWIFVELL